MSVVTYLTNPLRWYISNRWAAIAEAEMATEIDHEPAGAVGGLRESDEPGHETTQSELQAELAESQAEVERLEAKIAEMEEDAAQSDITITTLREQIEDSEKEKAAANEYLDRVRMVLDDYERRD